MASRILILGLNAKFFAPGSLAAGSFAKNSLDWQFQKASQWLGESIESWFSNSDLDVPDPTPLPNWFLQGLFWLVAVGLIVWAGWQLYRLLQPYWQEFTEQRPVWVASQQSVTDWLNQARAAQSQGNYQAACRALYMAALQRLSDQGLIPEQLSRTDGEYLTLLRSSLAAPAQTPYQTLIRTHERLFFDRVTASAELCDRCWQAYQQLERINPQPSQQLAEED
jgi:hypothetical protein